MKKNIHILLLLLLLANVMRAQTKWEFVGPRSTNQSADNKFETGQFNNITIDPNDAEHLFASSWFGGLWESKDRGATWDSVNIRPINSNGISAVCFLNSTEILVGDLMQGGRYGTNNDEFRFYSKAVWKYKFTTKVWSSLGALTNPSTTIPFRIKSIATYPEANTSVFFVCTTQGLYRSTDGGVKWNSILSDCVENMVFVPNGASPGNYFCYIAGSNGLGGKDGTELMPTGTVMVKESANINAATPTFTNLSSTFSLSKTLSHARICVGPTVSNVTQFFLNTLGAGVNFGGVEMFIQTFKKNLNAGAGVIITNNPTTLNTTGVAFKEQSDWRHAIAYDGVNNGIWFGGVRLNYLDLSTLQVKTSVLQYFRTREGRIHDDFHDLQIRSFNGQSEMYVAHDAGIARTIIGLFDGGLPPTSPDEAKLYFKPLNDELDVCLITGFSGTDNDKDLYAIGAHDIVNSDVFDAKSGKSKYTIFLWENDGAMIDKFNKDKMFFDHDQNHQTPYYATSVNGGQDVTTIKGFFNPEAGNEFKIGAEGDNFAVGFSRRLFFQDPYRPGRIFYLKHMRGIHQYVDDADPAKSAFVKKIYPGDIEPSPGIFGLQAWSMPVAMSFSPQTINSLHFLIAPRNDPTEKCIPAVIKYVGNNIDDCWSGHNATFYTDANGQQQPQWASLTGNLTSNIWSSFGISEADMYGIKFIDIETSPWNKDVVYVMLNVPHHPEIFVLKYNGSTWSNYSQGLYNASAPTGEIGFSMIMDHQSNDGIYLSTNRRIYYRDANPASQWQVYKTGPYVPAYQMEVNYADNTLRAGTYGRGIWKTGLECPALDLMTFNNQSIVPGFIQAKSMNITNSTTSAGKTILRATNSITLNPNFVADASAGVVFLAYIHGCSGPGNSFAEKTTDIFEVMQERSEEEEIETQGLSVFPNPNNGSFTIRIESEEENDVYVYNIMGQQVYEKVRNIDNLLSIDISSLPKGIYLVKVVTGNRQLVKKVVIE